MGLEVRQPTLGRGNMTFNDDLDEMYAQLARVRAAYLEKFGDDAPDYHPLETPEAIEDLTDAIKTGVMITDEEMPEGSVT